MSKAMTGAMQGPLSPLPGRASHAQAEREAGRPRVLMCPARSYDLRYAINPWMFRRLRVDRHLAGAQWNELHRVLEEEIDIELVEPIPPLPDFVFAANAGLVVGDVFVPSRFRHKERAREERHWKAWFAARGYKMRELPPEIHFEGEGDMLFCGSGLLAAGFGFRSDREAVLRVGDMLETEILPLELVDPWFYHLDTCFCPLDDRTVLYYPEAFAPASREVIAARFPDAVPVPLQEANAFVCNAVVVGSHVVTSPGCPESRAAIEHRGYAVLEVDVGEFLKAGGGVKCLVLFLDRGATTPAPSTRGAAAGEPLAQRRRS